MSVLESRGRSSSWLVVVAAVLGAHPCLALAANLDCSKPAEPHEVTICTHHDLLALAGEADGLWFAYQRVPFLMGASAARRDGELAFRRERAACGLSAACLRHVYRRRIEALRGDLGRAMESVRRAMNTSAPGLPGPVQAVVDGYAAQCRRLGGELVNGAVPRLMTGDLDGDGQQDYVLNPDNLACSTAATAFCGNGGCRITVALSRSGYKKPVEVMGGQPTLSQPEQGARLEVWVDRAHCNLADTHQSCWAIHSWKNGKAEQTYDIRPRSD